MPSSGHQHSPPPDTDLISAPTPQANLQVDPSSQLREQEPVHVTSHSAPAPQETLPLLPTLIMQLDASQLMLPLAPVVSSQVAPLLQTALQEPAQLPVQLSEPRQ